MSTADKEKKTIGRFERVDLPDWGLSGIEAKIDSGAYSSSLHCHHIEEYEKGGERRVRFQLLDPEHDLYDGKRFDMPISDTREVKSSNGMKELRHFIRTCILLFGQPHHIELSLTDRSSMKYPLLIGRKFLKSGFLIDVSKKNISEKQKSIQV
ncbi:MAG: RimK/LysX family protein [Bacteroidota bacterium]